VSAQLTNVTDERTDILIANVALNCVVRVARSKIYWLKKVTPSQISYRGTLYSYYDKGISYDPVIHPS